MKKKINKNNSNVITSIISTIFMIHLAGCASYNASALAHSYGDPIMSSSLQETDILVTAIAFTRCDCKQYLDRDVISKGYQPVQVFIQNNTNKTFIFSLNRISLPYASPEEVARTVYTSTIGRAAGYGAASLLLWPFIIPAIVDGVKSAQANDSLDHDFLSKTAKDQLLHPHSHINTLIFVPIRGYSNHFTITLLNYETRNPMLLNVCAS